MTKVNLISFGLKHRKSPRYDLLVDCRELANPWRVPELKPLDGRHEAVQHYVRNGPFYEKTVGDVLFAAQRSAGDLTVTFSCTGGHHRSVAMVEMVGAALERMGLEVTKKHMELDA